MGTEFHFTGITTDADFCQFLCSILKTAFQVGLRKLSIEIIIPIVLFLTDSEQCQPLSSPSLVITFGL